jgi:NADH dehydrogenase/NADH:ubiquinone oxidoreductase subunit G
MDLKSKIRVALGLEEPTTEVALAMEARLEDGTIVVSEANELVAGVDISILAEDGTLIPLPAGEYKTEAGVGFSVVDEGVVAEIYEEEPADEEETEEPAEDVEATEEVEMSTEETEETTETEEEVVEAVDLKAEVVEEIGTVIKELLSEVKADLSRLEAELNEVKASKDEVEAKNTELSKQVEELSQEPAAKPVNTHKFNAVSKVELSKPYSQMTVKERIKYNLNN